MHDKAMVIVNPASANGATRAAWPGISEKLASAGLSFDWVLTTKQGDATRLAREALQNGYRKIVAVGGDGTLNEVVNGFFVGDRPIADQAELGVISRGTGCDFIKTMAIPKDVESAAECLVNGKTATIDIGKVTFAAYDGSTTTRYFANVADLGLGGETVERVNRTTKAFGGFVSFLWGMVVSLLRYKNRFVEVTIDNAPPFHARINTLAVANGRFFGGGMKIAPNADPGDGFFDVVICGDFTKIEVLTAVNRLYAGTHLSLPKCSCTQARHVLVRSNERVLVEVDGEQPGTASAEFEILPAALNVRVSDAFEMACASYEKCG